MKHSHLSYTGPVMIGTLENRDLSEFDGAWLKEDYLIPLEEFDLVAFFERTKELLGQAHFEGQSFQTIVYEDEKITKGAYTIKLLEDLVRPFTHVFLKEVTLKDKKNWTDLIVHFRAFDAESVTHEEIASALICDDENQRLLAMQLGKFKK